MTQVLVPYKARIVFYDQLLKDAYSAYDDYLKQKQVLAHLSKVIQAIDDYVPSSTTKVSE